MMHGEYNVKYTAILRGIKFLFIYSTISRGTPNKFLQKPGCETTVQAPAGYGGALVK
jgi:hypothetical protein